MGCFGEVLADIMRRRYIAHIDLARALGVSPLLVGRWVRGEAVPAAGDVDGLLRVVRRCGAEDFKRLELAAKALLGDACDAHPRQLSRPLCEAEQELLACLPSAFRAPFADAFARS